jgi:hypothetical protein
MTTYYAVKFFNEIPTVAGITLLSAYDSYNIIAVDDGVTVPYFDEYPRYVELTEDEALIGQKFYGEGRDYRSAYSDVEGLTPDPDSLAQGKRKTKVYHTDATRAATLGLQKKIATRNVIDAFDTREDQSNKDAVLAQIDAITDIPTMLKWREEMLGIQMPLPLQQLYNLVDENGNRLNPVKWGVQF